MAQYQFITQERNGAAIADIGPDLSNRRMLFQLGQPGVVSASMNVLRSRARRDATGGLLTGNHEMIVYRDGTPLETVFALTKTDVAGDYDSVTLNLEWQGIASYLMDALVFPQATQYSSTTLPWTWINTFQTRTGGDYGITQGSVSGTPPTRKKTISSETTLFEAITDLSTSGDGFDWAINSSRALLEWHSQRGSDNGLVLEPGVNVAAWSYTENTGPGELVTDVYVNGPPGSQQVTASDSTARGVYGRREAALSFFADFEDSTVTTGQIQSHADSAIAARIAPIIIPQIQLVKDHPSVEWGSYWLGDVVTFRVRAGGYDFINALYRIVQIDVALDENNNETVTLGVNAL